MLEKLRIKYATNKTFRDGIRASERRNRERLTGRALCMQAKGRAKRDGREFALDPLAIQATWETDPHCAYCGVGLEMGTKAFTNVSPTLDRVDTARGYTPDNVVLACFRCNTLKRDATLEELKALVQNVERVLGRTTS